MTEKKFSRFDAAELSDQACRVIAKQKKQLITSENHQ
jgi:hypothetical protein